MLPTAHVHDESAIESALRTALGDSRTLARLVAASYEDLKRLARGSLRHGRDATMDTTSLVHELYLRVSRAGPVRVESGAHFMAICARIMRQLMSNHVRARHTEKRGSGAAPVDIDEAQQPASDALADEHVLIDQALAALEAIDPRCLRVFECRFLAGLSEEETASALALSLRTVQRDWLRARTWLAELLDARAVAA